MGEHPHCYHSVIHGEKYLEVCCECGAVKLGFSWEYRARKLIELGLRKPGIAIQNQTPAEHPPLPNG